MSITRTNQKRRIVKKMGNVPNCFKTTLTPNQDPKELYHSHTSYIIRTSETYCRAVLSDDSESTEDMEDWGEGGIFCSPDHRRVIGLNRKKPEGSDGESEEKEGGDGSVECSSDSESEAGDGEDVYDVNDGWDSESSDTDDDLWKSFAMPFIPYAAEYIEQQISIQNVRIANEKTEKLYCSLDVKRADSIKKVQFKPEPNLVTVIR